VTDHLLEINIEPESKEERTTLIRALSSCAKKDLSIGVSIDGTTGQTLLRAVTEEQLDLVVRHLREELKIAVKVGAPQIIYHYHSALSGGEPVLWEPIMALTIVTPKIYRDQLKTDLHNRRGQVTDVKTQGGDFSIEALVPLGTMFGYVNTLRSLTEGQATHAMQFDHYDPVPTDRDPSPLRTAAAMRAKADR